jgi:AcrR family transcriptional regulator
MPRAGLDSESVVRSAAMLADAEGLDAVTLARLADQLGVRAPSLYAHVDGLNDLRRRLAIRGMQELTDALQLAAAGRAGEDALRAIADAYRAYARAHPGTYAALQRAPEAGDPETTAAAGRVVDLVLAVLRGYGLEGDDGVHAARVVRAALHGFASLEMEGGFAYPLATDESYRRLVSVLDGGLRGEGAA